MRDLDGVLVTPDTIVFDMLGPLGTIVLGPSPIADSTGKYHVDLDLSLIGHYGLRWVTTGPGAGVKTDSLDVLDPFAAELLSLGDAKKYVQIADANTVHDEEIAGFIRALTPTIEFFVGPVEPRTMRRNIVGGGDTFVFPVAPVLEVISLESYSVAWNLSGFVLDSETGIVQYGYGAYFPRSVIAVFLAGRREVPAAINHAAKVVLGHLWETQRGRGTSGLAARAATSDTTFVPGLGYSVPNRAIELLKPLGTRTGLS